MKNTDARYIVCMSGVRFLRSLLLLLVLLLQGNYIAAQSGETSRPFRIAAVVTGDPEGESPGLTSLVLESIELELRLAGLQLSDSAEPDVLIRGSYDISGNIIRFNLSAAVPGDGTTLFAVTVREEMGFALDRVLLEYARRLAWVVADYRAKNEDVFGSAVDREAPGPAQVKPAEPPAGDGRGKADEGPIPPEEQGGFVLTTDLGVFLAAGEAGRYLKTGYTTTVFVGYAVAPRTNLGISAGAMYFTAEGYANEARGIVFSAGPGLRLKGKNSGRFVPGFRAEAGAAIFMVTPENDATRMKIVPAAEAGMTVDILLGGLTLQAAMDLTMFYENGAILYGFTPRIGLEF